MREFLLALNPLAIDRGNERGNALLAKRGAGISAQDFAQRLELQHTRRTVNQLAFHRSFMVAGAECRIEVGNYTALGEIRKTLARLVCACARNLRSRLNYGGNSHHEQRPALRL